MVNLGAAVNVIQAIRTHTAQQTGCPEWDVPGIRAMLTGSEGSPGSVLAAACLAAEDSACLKPSVAALRTHWPVNALSSLPRVPNLDLCPDHGNPRRDCLDCRRDAGPDLTPEQIAANAQALRAQVREMQRQVREGNAERRRLQGAQP